MKPENRKILMFIAFSLIAISGLSAQPKSAGVSFSLGGISASYEHVIDSESFVDIGLKAECTDMFFGNSTFPGITASVTWNMVFATKESCNGNEIRFFAGPGMTFGAGHDLLRLPGVIIGLKGRIGAECEFDRNMTISVSLNPVIGTHIQKFEDYIDMRCYRSGLISTFLPEVGIKHRF